MMIIIMTKPGEGTLVLERGQRRRGCSGNPSCSGLAEVDHHDNHDDDDGDDADDDDGEDEDDDGDDGGDDEDVPFCSELSTAREM